ncbi:hypothetical protein B9T31_12140 [Acinetobacter sp. ANC 4558]|uniref:hypothetical protein n=1 Tax=Acinetobacter sp. ANC 4558 TaxID=1977876 RepID=UPI000A32DE71|nr:hypothetical protein [Acinetobacter sp. ANC 4558]OTG85534.1 hypothetical protein B9T31_12140 [Acinetobacter sp. ANC 4558]
MSFITIEQAEAILGADFADDGDKARLVLLANTWMKKNAGQSFDPVPYDLQVAACEIIKGIQAKAIYNGQSQALKKEKVKADGVESEEEYQDGSVTISSYEQIALDLIASIEVDQPKTPYGIYLTRV